MSTVLIADDSMLIRMELKKFFEGTMKFSKVHFGTDGQQAVDLFKEHKPGLVTLDLTMPNKDGIQALEEIMTVDPSARVIVISAIRDKAKMTKALSLGAKGYVQKPLEMASSVYVAKLKHEVEEALK